MTTCESHWINCGRFETTTRISPVLPTLPGEDIERLLELGEVSLKVAVGEFGNSADPKFSDERVKLTLCIVSLWAKIRHKTEELKLKAGVLA
jgi:hypothetical protein